MLKKQNNYFKMKKADMTLGQILLVIMVIIFAIVIFVMIRKGVLNVFK